jgi:hypothetical protein
MTLTRLIFLGGLGNAAMLVVAAMVPAQLDWRSELRCLSTLNRQMHWVYGSYVWLSIAAFAAMSLWNARELASGTGLARSVCAYIAVFWGIRLILQGVFDSQRYLTTWWLKAGYRALTMLFAVLTVVYGLAAVSLVF